MAQTPAQIAEKWARRLSGSTQDITAGVQAVTTSPTQQAAAAVDNYIRGVQDAVATGKLQAGLNRVTLTDWKNAMIQKGVPRIASGATAAQPKFQDFMNQFLPHVESGAAQVRTMPKGTVEDGVARASAMIRHNASFQRR